ncbi:VWA-like domain-containing protein [Shinella sp. JR1-6]|uniref:vWA domain-containing protein n=1 Tax=Shinella sp. JR1-6 TaxID=2527671 RepID=UPI00102D5D1F|nr:VWA-like domain-containing protein [Shinella sp. JR1-6]TAA54594.1 hypothetical protein EXZ48_26580 [Shinella sp. JR1-6]
MPPKLDIESKLLAAKTALMFEQPFFGAMIVQKEIVEDPRVPTMATDGKRFYYNTRFVEKLSKRELVFVLAHEILHDVFYHHTRMGNRDPEKWNIAGDYVINFELKESSCGEMPKGGLYDPQYGGMSTEDVYRLLPDKPPSQSRGKSGRSEEDTGASSPGGGGTGAGSLGVDPGGCGGTMPAAPTYDREGLASAETTIATQVAQAAAIAKAKGNGIGKLSAGLQRLIADITKPKVNWRERLRRFADEVFMSDYSWARPSRRFLPHRLVMPSIVPTEGIRHIVCCVDTSGSVDDDMLAECGGEISGILDDGNVELITVIYTDAAVCNVETFQAGDTIRLRAAGGGGTAFTEAFRYIKRHHSDATAIIFLTDLCTYDFGEKPEAPVIWAHTGTKQAFDQWAPRVPFGEVIRIEP